MDSPYEQVITHAYDNLSRWIPVEGQPRNAPEWAKSLQRYATAEKPRQEYQKLLHEIGERLDPQSFEQTSFAFTREVFTARKPEESDNPLLRAWRLTLQMEQIPGDTLTPSANLVSRLLQDQVRFIWDVLLYQSSLYLQGNWQKNILVPLQKLPVTEQPVRLYDPKGEIGAFLGEARVFLKNDEAPTEAPIIGGKLSLSPSFLQMLSNRKQLQAIFDGSAQPVRITAEGLPRVEGFSLTQTPQAVFAMTCGSTPYRISNTPGETSKLVQWSYQGCGDVSISIYFSNEQGQEFTVTKQYPAPLGFLQFLRDFASGSRRFSMADFPQAHPAIFTMGIREIEVSYRVEMPSLLTKMLSVLQSTTPPAEIIMRMTS